MTTESKEKALPGYKSLASVQKQSITIQGELLIEQRITNDFLEDLIKLHTEHNDNWKRLKRKEGRLTMWLLVLANIALYVDISRDDSVAVSIAYALKGLLLL